MNTILEHEKITKYMIDQGWYHPWNIKEQIQFDLKNMETALNAPTL